MQAILIMRKLLNAAVLDWLLEVPCRVSFIAKFCGSLFVICCHSSEAFGRRGMLNLISDTAAAMSVVKKGALFSQHHSLPRGHFLTTRMLALTFRSHIGRTGSHSRNGFHINFVNLESTLCAMRRAV